MLNNKPVQINETLTPISSAVDLEIYDPPMCCSTGLCGPNIDQEQLDVSEMVHTLQTEGLRVERYQMTTHPAKFTGNSDVMQLIREKQMAALPIIVLRGAIIAVGSYPKLSDVQEHLKRSI
ncbi:MAG: arsenite efflux transporter metallochaperone ArsD [Brevefilum sp.]